MSVSESIVYAEKDISVTKGRYAIFRMQDTGVCDQMPATISSSVDGAWQSFLQVKRLENPDRYDLDRNRYIKAGYFVEEIR